MASQHAKGTASKIEGKVEEVAGRVTGNKGQELHGRARQIQGSGQQALGDLQDAVRQPTTSRHVRSGTDSPVPASDSRSDAVNGLGRGPR